MPQHRFGKAILSLGIIDVEEIGQAAPVAYDAYDAPEGGNLVASVTADGVATHFSDNTPSRIYVDHHVQP